MCGDRQLGKLQSVRGGLVQQWPATRAVPVRGWDVQVLYGEEENQEGNQEGSLKNIYFRRLPLLREAARPEECIRPASISFYQQTMAPMKEAFLAWMVQGNMPPICSRSSRATELTSEQQRTQQFLKQQCLKKQCLKQHRLKHQLIRHGAPCA